MDVSSFLLGTHQPHWMWHHRPLIDFPLFVSHRRLSTRDLTRLRPAEVDVAVDSGGFTEHSMYGEWRTSPQVYAAAAPQYCHRLERVRFVAPQDWMFTRPSDRRRDSPVIMIQQLEATQAQLTAKITRLCAVVRTYPRNHGQQRPRDAEPETP